MQLKQLEYLAKIVECGSISQAAQQLYLSQPSLTKAISQLEKEYGIQILVRKARGIELTKEGIDFLYYAKGILVAAEAMDRAFFRPDEKKKSRLFIASQQLDFVYDLFLERYHQNIDRGIHYGLLEVDRRLVIDSVLRGESDVGIYVQSSVDLKSFLSPYEQKRLEFHVLDRAGVYACVGPKSLLYNCETATYEETRNQLLVALDMEAKARQHTYFNQTALGFNSSRMIFFNTVNACERFLMETDALLFISKWTMKFLKNEKIHKFRVVPGPKDGQEIYNELIWIKRVSEPLSWTEQQFVKSMEDLFQTENQKK